MSSTIATVPTNTDGIAYAIVQHDFPMATRNEFVRIEIRKDGEVFRDLLIDVSALDGVIDGLQRVAEMRERARVETHKLLSRVGREGAP